MDRSDSVNTASSSKNMPISPIYLNNDEVLMDHSDSGNIASSSKNFQRPIMPPTCENTNCRWKCFEKISTNRRDEIFKRFLRFSFGERRHFMDKYIKRIEKVQKLETSQNKRNFSNFYSLPLENGKTIMVCKKMFLSTIGKRSDNIVVYHFKAKNFNNGIALCEDRRGLKINTDRKNKRDIKAEEIIYHINRFNPQVS